MVRFASLLLLISLMACGGLAGSVSADDKSSWDKTLVGKGGGSHSLFDGFKRFIQWNLDYGMPSKVARVINKDSAVGKGEVKEVEDRGDISLFISRRAFDESSRVVELDAALAANLANSALVHTYVLLENSTSSHNCSHFMIRLRKSGVGKLERLRCVDRAEMQPTYREMYEMAFTIPKMGSIVILSNADIVFDHTIREFRAMPRNKLNVLSVTGGPQHTSEELRGYYERFVTDAHELLTSREAKGPGSEITHAGSSKKKTIPWNLCSSKWKYLGMSWDAYVFRRDSAPLSFNSSEYQETLQYRGREYFMNMFGAENAAAMAFHHSGLERRRLYYSRSKANRRDGSIDPKRWHPNNACRFVNAWHFHLMPKTHFNGSDSNPVVHNKWRDAGSSNICETMEECLHRTNDKTII